MDVKSLAPCGVICDICLGFQRKKKTCAGCNHEGYKPYHCTVCSIKNCIEKEGDQTRLCSVCRKFPCRRIRDLQKRYASKYGEDLYKNFTVWGELGPAEFTELVEREWTCSSCGHLLSAHSKSCVACGADNPHWPAD